MGVGRGAQASITDSITKCFDENLLICFCPQQVSWSSLKTNPWKIVGFWGDKL